MLADTMRMPAAPTVQEFLRPALTACPARRPAPGQYLVDGHAVMTVSVSTPRRRPRRRPVLLDLKKGNSPIADERYAERGSIDDIGVPSHQLHAGWRGLIHRRVPRNPRRLFFTLVVLNDVRLINGQGSGSACCVPDARPRRHPNPVAPPRRSSAPTPNDRNMRRGRWAPKKGQGWRGSNSDGDRQSEGDSPDATRSCDSARQSSAAWSASRRVSPTKGLIDAASSDLSSSFLFCRRSASGLKILRAPEGTVPTWPVACRSAASAERRCLREGKIVVLSSSNLS